MTIAVLVLYGIMFQYHFINIKEFEMEIWSKRYMITMNRNLNYVKSNISAKQILYVRVLHNINATRKRPPFLNMFSKNIAFTSWKKSHLHVHAIFTSERSFFVTLYITDLFWNMLQFLCQIFTMNKKCKRSLKL